MYSNTPHCAICRSMKLGPLTRLPNWLLFIFVISATTAVCETFLSNELFKLFNSIHRSKNVSNFLCTLYIMIWNEWISPLAGLFPDDEHTFPNDIRFGGNSSSRVDNDDGVIIVIIIIVTLSISVSIPANSYFIMTAVAILPALHLPEMPSMETRMRIVTPP